MIDRLDSEGRALSIYTISDNKTNKVVDIIPGDVAPRPWNEYFDMWKPGKKDYPDHSFKFIKYRESRPA